MKIDEPSIFSDRSANSQNNSFRQEMEFNNLDKSDHDSSHQEVDQSEFDLNDTDLTLTDNYLNHKKT